MMLLTPFLGDIEGHLDSNFAFTAIVGILILIATLFAATKVIPPLLYQIAKTRSRELFLMSVLTICFSVAWLTSNLGLSLSLGAFLAGLIISESEYRHEAISDILPFQDVFTSLFFVSIGMLLDLGFVLAQPFLILFIATAILMLKTAAGAMAAIVVGLPLRTAILSGLCLSQIGEFSFVLAKTGVSYGLADDYHYQLFLAVSLLTMGVTPSLIAMSTQCADLVLKLPLPVALKSGLKPQHHNQKVHLKNHIIIIGFGFSGRNLALAAKAAELPYVILEMNPETVKKEKGKGEPIHFGDATHEAVLRHIGIEGANVAAIVINDYVASRRIVELLRQINPKIYIVVRTRYFEQVQSMYQLGANDVIPDELGSSMEIFTRVLTMFQIPNQQIEKVVEDIRVSSYEKLKFLYKNSSSLYNLKFGRANVDVESFHISQNCHFHGKTLEELKLRKIYGVNVVAIKRKNANISAIGADFILLVDDVITVVGHPEKLKKMAAYFKSLELGTGTLD
jgi:CPA2 family monovalent cation:H+ antiporter-2